MSTATFNNRHILEARGVQLDPRAHEVKKGEDEIWLTFKEFAVLEYLMKNRGRAVTRREIIDCVWGSDAVPKSNVVDAKVKRIRRKIGDRAGELIETVRGVGYRLNE